MWHNVGLEAETMRFRNLILATCVTLLPILLIAQADKKAADAGPDFKALTQKVMDGWATLDGKNAAPFYVKDPGATFFDIAPMKYVGWPAYEAGFAKTIADYNSGKFTINPDFKV